MSTLLSIIATIVIFRLAWKSAKKQSGGKSVMDDYMP